MTLAEVDQSDGAAWGRRAPYAALLVLLVAAPFERLRPLVQLPGQALTTVECAILLAIGVCVAASALTRRPVRAPRELVVPWLVLTVALIVATLAAPDHRANAMRFTGRFVLGSAVALVVANVVSSPARLVGAAVAAMAAGAIVSIVALGEAAQLTAVETWLTQFRPGLAVVGGQVRAGSTLGYPTTASMYLEVVFGLGLAALLAALDRRAWARAALAGLVLTLITEAMIQTLTRSGLIVWTTVLALAVTAWRVKGGSPRGLYGLAATSVVFVLLVTVSAFGQQGFLLRLSSEREEGWYRAAFDAPDTLSMRPGEVMKTSVTVTNLGKVQWQSQGDSPFALSYHLYEPETQKTFRFDGARTFFRTPVEPNESMTLDAWVVAPQQAGVYLLAWDVVHEGRLWFSVSGSPIGRTRLQVGGDAASTKDLEWTPEPPWTITVGRLRLWTIAAVLLAAHPVLGVGPDNYRFTYGPAMGLKTWNERTHANNMYIELFVGAGVAGGLAFLWFVWRLVGAAFARLREAPPGLLPHATGGICALAAVLVHGMTDCFLVFTPTYVMIWTAFGLLASRALDRTDVRG